MKRLLFLLTVIALLTIYLLTSCGRKGPLEHLPDEKRPKFDKVIDEN